MSSASTFQDRFDDLTNWTLTQRVGLGSTATVATTAKAPEVSVTVAQGAQADVVSAAQYDMASRAYAGATSTTSTGRAHIRLILAAGTTSFWEVRTTADETGTGMRVAAEWDVASSTHKLRVYQRVSGVLTQLGSDQTITGNQGFDWFRIYYNESQGRWEGQTFADEAGWCGAITNPVLGTTTTGSARSTAQTVGTATVPIVAGNSYYLVFGAIGVSASPGVAKFTTLNAVNQAVSGTLMSGVVDGFDANISLISGNPIWTQTAWRLSATIVGQNNRAELNLPATNQANAQLVTKDLHPMISGSTDQSITLNWGIVTSSTPGNSYKTVKLLDGTGTGVAFEIIGNNPGFRWWILGEAITAQNLAAVVPNWLRILRFGATGNWRVEYQADPTNLLSSPPAQGASSNLSSALAHPMAATMNLNRMGLFLGIVRVGSGAVGPELEYFDALNTSTTGSSSAAARRRRMLLTA